MNCRRDLAFNWISKPTGTQVMDKMKRLLVLGFAVVTVFAAGNYSAPAAEDEAAKTIVERADRIRFPQAGYQVNVKITSSFPGREPDVRDYEILSKGNERTIIRTLAP